jgi:hypothetical protein
MERGDLKKVIRERVLNGAVLLDAHEPGWEHRIDLGRLWMSSCNQCLMGQLYGRYDRRPMPWAWFTTVAHGLSINMSEIERIGVHEHDYWEALTDEWRNLIRGRLSGVEEG